MNQVNPAAGIGIIAETMNRLGAGGIPFFFVIDFAAKNHLIQPLAGLDGNILYTLGSITNVTPRPMASVRQPAIILQKSPDAARYEKAFRAVIDEIRRGNTYLLNLTFPSKVHVEPGLLDIFHAGRSLFKLYFRDSFVSFSPERFVRIEDGIITTCPMKGTIDASIPGAMESILANEKEMAEHVMVVDLLRNDLSMVASRVRVERFRYVDRINAGNTDLLHVSSRISGRLDRDWQSMLGSIITTMLPAGSVTGTPKRKTVEIIGTVEGYERGFYTGVFGVYDGRVLDSAVLIRFVEKCDDGSFSYKSGGGITIDSSMDAEYAELVRKIYVPAAAGEAL